MQETAQIISPVDGTVYSEYELLSAEAALRCVESASNAQRKWKDVPLAKRCEILREAVALLSAESDEVILELARTMGRPVSQGGGELRGFAERANFMLDAAPDALADIVPEPIPGFKRYIRREPVGTALTIAPWNFPYMSVVNTVWPALIAGNAVLLKHAHQTTVAARRVERILLDAGLPIGTFQAVPMSHGTTAEVINADLIRLIFFTGSVRGGRTIQKAAADSEGFPDLGLELGGKDAAYVRPDANMSQAIAGVADGICSNSGQSCCSIERVYVHESVYDEFVAGLGAEVAKLELGSPIDISTSIGPMVTAEAANFVRRQVNEALESGARLAGGAHRSVDSDDAYLAPRLVLDVDHSMRVMNEESFGPIAGVMAVQSDEEAIGYINDSPYGLTASIWTDDLDAAESVGQRLEVGTVFMNRCDYLDPALAWTGVKNTGRGCTMSVLGYEKLTRPKSFHLRTELKDI